MTREEAKVRLQCSRVLVLARNLEKIDRRLKSMNIADRKRKRLNYKAASLVGELYRILGAGIWIEV